MKRKLTDVSSDASLSPPPDNLASATTTAAEPTVQPVVSNNKRAVQYADTEDASAGTEDSLRPKRRAAKKLKVTEDTFHHDAAAEEGGDGELKAKKTIKKAAGRIGDAGDTTAHGQTSSRPKRGAAKKAIVEEDIVAGKFHVDVDVDVNVNVDSRKTHIKSTPSTKKATKGKQKQSNKEYEDHEERPKTTNQSRNKTVNPAAPIEKRTTNTALRIGAHVSSAGGVSNAILNIVNIGGNAFAVFLKNHRKWDSLALDPEQKRLFIELCQKHSISAADCCLPHGSYLVNLAHPDPVRKKQAYGSFLDDLIRCHTLGISLYNFHPGNANATTREDGIRIIAENLNKAHQDPATGSVITVLETMATQGNTIGSTFQDLAAIIELVKDKSRIGICLDTCHVFAAGYDLRSPEAYAHTMEKFDKEIGLKYLKAFHINDSKAPLSSHRDLHARIGTGHLGLQAFHNLMNDTRFHGLPMVLETPANVIGPNGKKIEDKSIWAREIKLLENLIGMDIESEEFKALNERLRKEGESEAANDAKDAKPKKKRASKKKGESEEEDAKPKKKRASKKKVEIEEEDIDDDIEE
ncbi:AP endonuclease [Clathrospora elynae]|uniref:Apurinic-apyrimidinic endonuclease 1 n=1 Tax=Clathrospora elynae TaxID=706981 RepID=A0A6A5SKM4_9PLEO|nr:AP endonuclease [Clathrospora elynae]